ncbi:hypothetical protein SHELI_v1c01860 [Spiroplasma helicoides]|uniref:Phosphatidic acid phosphatase type 2/haloperoxidase domain-containing protein n=1 Tax=Spiroplasma helicoides TaxID=216938 RepID=A0A1B3SJP1_9MOLU|nr:phosphatase PAP2 family protein [Spiroplasma helicoides]AOG60141.1 hypothetical protein SHELI_v1c01860 [Spiroplasma helicoides]
MFFKTKKNNIIFWTISFSIFLGIFAVGIVYDFTIANYFFSKSAQLEDKTSFIKYFFNIYGMSVIVLPIYISIVTLVYCLTYQAKITKQWIVVINVFITTIYFLATLYLSVYSTYNDYHNSFNNYQLVVESIASCTILILVALSIIFIYLFLYTKKITKEIFNIEELAKKAGYCILYILLSLITINIIKIGVGRLRPYQVFEFDDSKSHFYYPFQVNTTSVRGNSFPSGHVHSSLCVFGFLYFINTKTKRQKISFWALFSIFSIMSFLTLLSRLFISAHFFTDTLFSLIICLFWFVISKTIINKMIKKDLKKQSLKSDLEKTTSFKEKGE